MSNPAVTATMAATTIAGVIPSKRQRLRTEPTTHRRPSGGQSRSLVQSHLGASSTRRRAAAKAQQSYVRAMWRSFGVYVISFFDWCGLSVRLESHPCSNRSAARIRCSAIATKVRRKCTRRPLYPDGCCVPATRVEILIH